MSFDGDEKPWICGGGGGGGVNLRRMGSIVKEMGEPCLHPSPTKATKMLKPEKWRSIFDSDGKITGFNKALKMIVVGGVDPSIRAEVWEFLLGCYAISSTKEYREQLRTARRERYRDLINQCQMMHASVGTGELAYVIGSKVMDVRKSSKEGERVEVQNEQVLQNTADVGRNHENNGRIDSHAYEDESSSESDDFVSVRKSTDGATYDSSGEYYSAKAGRVTESELLEENYFDFPPLPVTNLFEKSNRGRSRTRHKYTEDSSSTPLKMEEPMHSFQISNNVDLIMEELPSIDVHAQLTNFEAQGFLSEFQKGGMNGRRISGRIDPAILDPPVPCEVITEGKVADWLWTLHRIVVDVVRTDNHLEFFEDTKNIARMSDILAVYAWIDPETGYCQGMSDLLSPFIVLYEDNADAFWCFEMLLRRMRQNFVMEGPVGVMKQLQALGRILQLTDFEIFSHLSVIGAESFLFAFRMLLVLFRRELSFNDALRMWEMIWAADFDEALSRELEASCLEPLVLHLPTDPVDESRDESEEDMDQNAGVGKPDQSTLEKSLSENDNMLLGMPFCGLKASSFWPRNGRLSNGGLTCMPTISRDDGLSVFCVAAVLIINRLKILKRTNSMDDLIKMFNDKKLEIKVRRCIRIAIRLRKKYFYKVIKLTNNGHTES